MNHRFHMALCALVVAASAFVVPASAQADEAPVTNSRPRLMTGSEWTRAIGVQPLTLRSTDIDRAIQAPQSSIASVANLQRTASRSARRQDSRGPGRIIAGAAVGALAGFFAGGYIGAGLEPDCNCDDPGLKGFLIGAPTGAVVGGILGGKFLF
jgi:hypothetical protein